MSTIQALSTKKDLPIQVYISNLVFFLWSSSEIIKPFATDFDDLHRSVARTSYSHIAQDALDAFDTCLRFLALSPGAEKHPEPVPARGARVLPDADISCNVIAWNPESIYIGH